MGVKRLKHALWSILINAQTFLFPTFQAQILREKLYMQAWKTSQSSQVPVFVGPHTDSLILIINAINLNTRPTNWKHCETFKNATKSSFTGLNENWFRYRGWRCCFAFVCDNAAQRNERGPRSGMEVPGLTRLKVISTNATVFCHLLRLFTLASIISS